MQNGRGTRLLNGIGIAFGIGLVLVLLYMGFGCSFVDDYRRNQQREIAEAARQRAISEFSQRYRADQSWLALVERRDDQFQRLLTIDLQDVWLKGPILFQGTIHDVERLGRDRYSVQMVEDSMAEALRLSNQQLRLELNCDVAMVDQLLRDHPQSIDALRSSNDVVVVATIIEVRGGRSELRRGSCVGSTVGPVDALGQEWTAEDDDCEGALELQDTLTGIGTCIALDYFGLERWAGK